MNNDQKGYFFHHLLTGHAFSFYDDEIDGKAKSFHERATPTNRQFNSDINMESIADRIRGIHIYEFEMKGKDKMSALKELSDDIQMLRLQAPKHPRNAVQIDKGGIL